MERFTPSICQGFYSKLPTFDLMKFIQPGDFNKFVFIIFSLHYS